MHKISLKDWVILLTILPTTLIGISLAAYFSFHRYAELGEYLTLSSDSIIGPLALAAETPMSNQNREKLRQMVGFIHRNHALSIKNIIIYTPDNQEFVTSAYHADSNMLRLAPGETLGNATTVTENGGYLIFRAPILKEDYEGLPLTGDYNPNYIGYVAIQIDKDRIMLEQQTQVIIAFAIVFLGVLVNAFFAFRLIRNVTQPISAMVQAIDKIREGKLESRVSGELVGELNFLKSGINAMGQSLGDYHDEMQRSIDQATLDLRESLEQFEIQNVELDLAKRKAQDANRVKSEFLANMSHELRTPLNGVIGFTRQVLKTPLSETQRDYLQTIDKSASNLLSIINDILDFSKLDAGRMVIESIPFPLRDSMEEVLTILAPAAHKKNIELSMLVNQHTPDSLIGDAMRIKQVIINLVGNAIKFTDKGSVDIDVTSESLDNNNVRVKITITDTGIGIDPKQKKTLFEAFSQADKSITRLYGGTGLGLVISKHLAEEMHGDIGFSSEANRGSIFWFTFETEVNPLPLSTPVAHPDLVGKRVLYLEPHPHSRMTATEIMNSWQMQVTPISSLSELSEELSTSEHFDIALIAHDVSPTALSDLKSLISTVKHSIDSVHIAINSNSPNLKEALVASGAINCVSKPLTPQKLLHSLVPKDVSAQSKSSKQINNLTKLPIKVLAVDDNEANLKLITALLNELVEEVITADNGQQAVDLCQEEKFALIFMDIQMPVMDGVTALKHISTSILNAESPVIAVTAHALSGEKEKLLEEGFHSYMTKPLDETMLRHVIYEHCDLDTLLDEQDLDNNFAQALPLFAGESSVFDWDLALKRANNKPDLAKDMLQMLVNSLPEATITIKNALDSGDEQVLKAQIHKLNGACCYTGTPNLGKITNQLETQLKKDTPLADIEPEFFEFFDEIEKLQALASNYLDEMPVN
jgi:two-component system sensor histidine kinase BarA